MATFPRRPIQIVTGTSASLGSGDPITLPIGAAGVGRNIILWEVRLKHSSGSATTSTPFVVSTAGAAATSVACLWSYSATAVATLIADADIQAAGDCNVSENLYLYPEPDAGSDNVYDYVVVYEVL